MNAIQSKPHTSSWNTTWFPTIYMILGCIACSFINDTPAKDIAIIGFVSLVACIILCIAMNVKKKFTWQTAIYFVFFLGFVLRILYVLYTSYTTRQHDVWFVTSGKGHMAYIQYIANNLSIPLENQTWQFYHPPLHHIFAGILYRLLSQVGLAPEFIAEKLQFLTIGYSCLTMIACDRLFAAFKLQDRSRFIADCLIAFQPTFLLVGGGLNNDMLYAFLAILSITLFVKWWNEEKTIQLILSGLCLGLSMMAKISAALLAIPYAYLLLAKLYSNWSKTRKKTILQILSFGVISVPIGMWYPIRNLILFNQPLGYVPGFGDDSTQYIGSYNAFQRLFSFPIEQLTYPYQCWGDNSKMGMGYNIFLSLFKTSAFGEYSIKGGFWSYILLYIFIIITLIAVFSIFESLLNSHKKLRNPPNNFLLIGWLTLMISFIGFCLNYKFICSQDFRYLILTLPFLAIAYAKIFEKMKAKKKRIVLEVFLFIFCLSSYMIYAIPIGWGI